MKKTLFSLILAMLVAAPVLTLPSDVAQAASRNIAIRGTSSNTVYWNALDGKRYVFPNASVFYSWYPNFDSVNTITDGELYAIPIGGNVTYRPGANLVKVTTDPKVYAVARGGILRHVTSEYLASRLFGANWNSRIVDVPDSYFTNYTVGSPIYNESDYNVSQEYNGVSNPADSLRGSTGTNTVGDIVLNASRTSINPGEAVLLSVSNVPNYGSSYRLEIYDTRNNGIVRTCNLPVSYCDVTVYPQRNSTENSVQYYAALRDSSSLTVKSGYSPVINFGSLYGGKTYSLYVNASKTTASNEYVTITASAGDGSSYFNGYKMELYKEIGSGSTFVSTCSNQLNCSFQVYISSADGTSRFYVLLKNSAGQQIANAWSPYIYTSTSGSTQNGTLALTVDRTTIASGEGVALTATYSGNYVYSGLIEIKEVRTGSIVKSCRYSTACSVTVYPVQNGYSSTQYVATVSTDSGSLIATQYSPTISFNGSSYNNGVNYINGLVLNADRTSINPGNVVRLTANAYHAGTWSYSGNRITITDMHTSSVVKTCYDVSTCTVDVYPQAYSSTNLTSQYQAKIYDRNGVLAMSQYSPVIYLSSYSGTTYGYDYGYSYSYTQTTGRGLVTFAPTENLRTNQMIYLTATFVDTNIPVADSVVRLYTERSSTAIATCTGARTCSVSYPTGADPMSTRVYARLSSRSLTYTTLESERVNMVTTR